MEIDRRKFLKLAIYGSIAAVVDACSKRTTEPTLSVSTKPEAPTGRTESAATQTLSPGVGVKSTAKPFSTPETLPSPEIPNQVKFLKGVDLMKLSKDRLRDPLKPEDKMKVINMIKGLGITHVTIDTPYDDPPGLNAQKETKEWTEAIRADEISIVHRHMFTKFEAIYDQKKDPTIDYIGEMKKWMIKNADLIKDGDIWTPMPEPQNGGINGVNCGKDCMFASKEQFNEFIQKITTTAKDTLKQLNKNVEVVCCGFDLFIASGNNNPDWEGKSFLDKLTVETVGCPALDHYPQPDYKIKIRRDYKTDLQQFINTWPDQCFILTEVGKQEGLKDAEKIENMFNDFSQFTDKGLMGVFWWPINIDGSDEGLLNPDFSPRPTYAAVKNGFAKLPEYVANK